MKKIKNQILGTIAFILFFAGMTSAAQSVDPVSQEIQTKQEIKEFAAFCGNGLDPR